jgi:hypothetical protein
MRRLGSTRQKLRRGAFGSVGLGVVLGATAEPTPGAVLVAAGAVGIALDERLVRSRIPFWGDD